MQLFTYYSLDECENKDYIIEKLNALVQDGKIEYELVEKDLIKIEDIELEDSEIEDLLEDFDKYDVIADLGMPSYEDDDESYDYDEDDEDY